MCTFAMPGVVGMLNPWAGCYEADLYFKGPLLLKGSYFIPTS